MIATLRKRVLRRIPDVQTELGGWDDEMIPEDRDTVRRIWDEDVDLGNGVRRRAMWNEHGY